jgi:hypothetical protein
MTVPTIPNFFGVNAQVLTANTSVTATALDPVLCVKYSDLAAVGWTSLAGSAETDPEKWLTSIIKLIKNFTTANTDELPNVVVDAPLLGLEFRNSLTKRRYSYSVDIYETDTGATEPNPTNI